MKKVGLIFTIIIAICLSMPSLVSASIYSVMATENTSAGGSRYGTHAHNYVPSSATITNKHINSVYLAHSDLDDGVEIGWYWKVGPYLPQGFCVRVVNWYYEQWDFGSVGTGAWHVFSVYNDNNDNRWTYYYDGTWPIIGLFHSRLNYGRTYTSSERNYRDESNYAHFNGIQMKLINNTWLDWTNLASWYDNDPDYWLNKISNVEHTVINS